MRNTQNQQFRGQSWKDIETDAPEGLNLFQANGAVAGQTVNHFHLHVLPRHARDGMGLTWPRPEPGPEALERHAEQLRDALRDLNQA